MGPTLVLRTSTARLVGAVTMGVGLLGLASLAFSDRASLLTYGIVMGGLALVGWAAFWTPYVEISDGGVVMRNVLRTVVLPWPAVQDVDGRYGLRLTTAYGRFTSWSATAPAGRARLAGIESEAATEVRRRRDELAAYLTDPRLERERPTVRWHWPELAAAAGLFVLALVSLQRR